MAYKMKGIFKGLKVISQIFVVKEHEMEIGCPTDVKHVAHIGWNSSMPTGNASPSWMNGIRVSSDISYLDNFAPSTGTSWASQDFDQPRDMSPFGVLSVSENAGKDAAPAALCPDVPRPPRKTRRRKKTVAGSPVSSSLSKDSSAPVLSSAAAAADASNGDNGTQ